MSPERILSERHQEARTCPVKKKEEVRVSKLYSWYWKGVLKMVIFFRTVEFGFCGKSFCGKKPFGVQAF